MNLELSRLFESILNTNGTTLDGRVELEPQDIADLRKAISDSVVAPAPERRRPVGITFQQDAEHLVVACDDGSVWRLTTRYGIESWTPFPTIPQT